MTKEEFVPGRRVYLIWGGERKYGTCGHLWDSQSEPELCVRFDDDKVVRVLEKFMPYFHLDMSN